MSNRGDYRTFNMLVKFAISIIIGFIVLAYRFLKEVARLNLWGTLGKSLLLSVLYLAVSCVLTGISNEVAGTFILIGVIYFCDWWHNKLSYADTRLNADKWKQRQWWWTLDGWQFEQEVARVFRINGYNATVTKGSGDGGVDIILKKDGYKAIVQCKHYQNPVPPEPVRALWGCKDDFGADEVIIVASSGLSEMSAKFIQNKPNYKALNLDDIIDMSEQANQEMVNCQSIENKETVSGSRYGRKLDL